MSTTSFHGPVTAGELRRFLGNVPPATTVWVRAEGSASEVTMMMLDHLNDELILVGTDERR